MKEFCDHGHCMADTGYFNGKGHFICRTCKHRRDRESKRRTRQRAREAAQK